MCANDKPFRKTRLASVLRAALIAALVVSCLALQPVHAFVVRDQNSRTALDSPSSVAGHQLLAAARPGPPARDDDAAYLASLQLLVPVTGVQRAMLRDTYNDARGGKRHEALDIPARRGTPVIAASAGHVAKLFKSVAGGLTVYQFDPGERFALYYAHLDAYAEGLREGAELSRGDLIGYVGTTGNAPANAPHLHFAIFRMEAGKQWWRGVPINPFVFLTDQ